MILMGVATRLQSSADGAEAGRRLGTETPERTYKESPYSLIVFEQRINI